MASMADDFNALRGGEGVTGSAHSGGGLKATGNGSNHVSMACGEGNRQHGPMAVVTLFRPGDVDRLQRETTRAKRKQRAKYGQVRWGCTKIFTIFQTII
jgi:hypothetical protein